MSTRTRIWKPILTIVAALVAFKVVCVAMVLIMFIALPSGDVEGPAPNASISVRRQWGQHNFGVLFSGADKWVRENAEIVEAVGEVHQVAPIGGPNRYSQGFGEASAAMNLQVVGENGEGVIELKKVTF